ncbi:MAG TPA: ABC transporter permease [Gaiellaceae bacterium]|jgi:ABC-2 type transport system permease protein
MTSFRVFAVGGVIAYRALFNWISPWMYIPTMFGSPLFQILFFTYLGRYSGVEDDSFFIVGNAVQVCAMSSVYAMTMTIANERWFATLSPLLATPANRLALFLGRGFPVLANGLLVSAFGFFVGWALLDFDPAAGSIPPLVLVVVVTVTSCTAFGMLLGSLGLRARDVFFAANLAYFLMLLFCGVNVPIEELPGWMQTISSGIPLTHGIAAAREVASGATLSSVSDLVLKEAAVGLCYAVAAYGLFRFFEAESRRRATLETM